MDCDLDFDLFFDPFIRKKAKYQGQGQLTIGRNEVGVRRETDGSGFGGEKERMTRKSGEKT